MPAPNPRPIRKRPDGRTVSAAARRPISAGVEQIKQLRQATGAGMMDAKAALLEAKGDLEQAHTLLRKKGLATATKRAEREAKAGLVDGYLHMGRIGSLVEVNCETDFVARTEDFKNFVHEIAMQVAAIETDDVSTLLKQPAIHEPELSVEDKLSQLVSKLGEKIEIKRFIRYEIGDK